MKVLAAIGLIACLMLVASFVASFQRMLANSSRVLESDCPDCESQAIAHEFGMWLRYTNLWLPLWLRVLASWAVTLYLKVTGRWTEQGA